MTEMQRTGRAVARDDDGREVGADMDGSSTDSLPIRVQK
jgi:hypothetical protein